MAADVAVSATGTGFDKPFKGDLFRPRPWPSSEPYTTASNPSVSPNALKDATSESESRAPCPISLGRDVLYFWGGVGPRLSIRDA